MYLSGEHRLHAPRALVWSLLLDPEVLRRSIPGCLSLEGSVADGFSARVQVAVGPIKAVFEGAVSLNDLDPPSGCTIVGQGQGGIAGFASGQARVSLDETDGETVLRYAVDAMVGGKLAQLGGRLIDATATKLAGQFFDAFARIVAEQASVS
jgi:uncharacterized protein